MDEKHVHTCKGPCPPVIVEVVLQGIDDWSNVVHRSNVDEVGEQQQHGKTKNNNKQEEQRNDEVVQMPTLRLILFIILRRN